MDSMTVCPKCTGDGTITVLDIDPEYFVLDECDLCKSEGVVEVWEAKTWQEGNRLPEFD